MTTTRIEDFREDLARAREIVGLGQALWGSANGRVDVSDMYRAALVQGVAAWDRYLHGVILDRAVKIVLGLLNHDRPGKIGLPLPHVARILAIQDQTQRELETRGILVARFARETFQKPNDVADGLAMVGIPRIWSAAFPEPESVIHTLSLIVDRRNKIVHECDRDPVVPNPIHPIVPEDVSDSLSAISDIAERADPHCR